MDRLIISLIMIGLTAGQCSPKCAKGHLCCKFGVFEGSCPGHFGCMTGYCCQFFDCFHRCGRKGGSCPSCVGSESVCCRKGWSSDPIECGKGNVGCDGWHCCVTPATEAEICGTTIDDNWRLVDIHYDIGRSTLTKYPPTTAGNQYIDNSGGSTHQEIRFAAVETYQETKSFSHSTGISISVGVSFSAGIPLISKGKITTTISTSYDFTYGKQYSESKETSTEFKCRAAAGKKVRCEVTFNEFEVKIPYTASWERKDLPKRCKTETKGVYTGVSAFDMHMQVTESRC